MTRTWVNRSNPIIAWIWLATWTGGPLLLVFSPRISWWGAVLAELVCGLLGALGWIVIATPSLSLEGDHIIVTNPFRRIEIYLGALQEIESGQFLMLHLRDGQVIRVWSVVAANVSLMFGKPSHVDRVAAELRKAVAATVDVAPRREVIKRPETFRFLGFAVAVAAALSGVLHLVVG